MYKFKFADVGEGIHEGLLSEWYVKEGDKIEEGKEVYSVETDKFTTDVTSPVSGTIKKIYYEAGSEIKVGDLLVDIDDGSENEAVSEEIVDEPMKDENIIEGASVVGTIKVSDEIISSYSPDSNKKDKSRKKALATPVARNLAKMLGVDINDVKGTGPQGRVKKEDINKYVEQRNSTSNNITKTSNVSKDDDNIEIVKMSKIRETISNNMELSKFSIPHTSAMYEINVTQLWELRKEINESLKEENIKLSFLPFIVKALIAALKKHPVLNSELTEDKKEIIIKHFYNIGLAMDTEAGLVVPVLRDADKMTLIEIQKELSELSEKAHNKKLAVDSMTDGTFTITNYGSIGGIFGTPIINYPQVAILGIGTIYKRPEYDKNDNIVPAYILPVSISFDHRVVDGGEVSRFAMALSKILSSKSNIIAN